MSTDLAVVGTVVPRMGLVDKVQGKTRYTADLKRPGMLYGRSAAQPACTCPYCQYRCLRGNAPARMRC